MSDSDKESITDSSKIEVDKEQYEKWMKQTQKRREYCKLYNRMYRVKAKARLAELKESANSGRRIILTSGVSEVSVFEARTEMDYLRIIGRLCELLKLNGTIDTYAIQRLPKSYIHCHSCRRWRMRMGFRGCRQISIWRIKNNFIYFWRPLMVVRLRRS